MHFMYLDLGVAGALMYGAGAPLWAFWLLLATWIIGMGIMERFAYIGSLIMLHHASVLDDEKEKVDD